MKKVIKKPSPSLFPVPAVLVTSYLEGFEPNIITIAWTGILNSEPPMVYISVNPIRHSHKIINESGEFVINIPSAPQAKLVDYCGIVSGRDTNKFRETGFTPTPSSHIKAPLIAECPINIECKVKSTLSLGSHDVFIADILAIHYNEDVLDSQGRPDFGKIQPYSYCLTEYRALTESLGSFGYSKRNVPL